MARRLFRKAVQQGRSERRDESYAVGYVEPLSVARTTLADFINSRLRSFGGFVMQLGLNAFKHKELEQCLIRNVAFVCDCLELIQEGFWQAERNCLGGRLQPGKHHPTTLGVVDILR